MQTIEHDQTAVLSSTATDAAAPLANYEAVRFNAMKHGILSRLVVLAHEDAGEFADLLNALIDEHRPAGMTERHLIEDLAAIMWRKRRVLLAEGARINEGLKSAIGSANSVVPAAAPFERGLSSDSRELADMLTSTPEETAQFQRETALDLEATTNAERILRKGGATAYKRARLALLPESRDWWDEHVADEEYPATAEGLEKFISEHLRPICYRLEKEARFAPAIKAQTLGEGMQVHRLEKLNRYETHLDRKFERTLAMILKMKELRNGR